MTLPRYLKIPTSSSASPPNDLVVARCVVFENLASSRAYVGTCCCRGYCNSLSPRVFVAVYEIEALGRIQSPDRLAACTLSIVLRASPEM